MAEFYFDTRDGSLLVGAAAIEPRVDEAGPAVVPLRDLLTDEEFTYTVNDFEKVPYRKWSREEMVQLGSWMLNVMHKEGESPPVLYREHYDRLYMLGLGPYRRQQKEAGKMYELRAAVGSPEIRDNGLYDHWQPADFAAYAYDLSRRLARRPLETDYIAADGPGRKVIRARIGGIGELNEMIGYPNIHAWSPHDYVEWGVQVMRANPHRKFNGTLIKGLSKQDRGPTVTPIYKYFDSVPGFVGEVKEELERQDAAEAAKRAGLLHRFEELKRKTEVPVLDDQPEHEKIIFVGKYELARRCLPDTVKREQLAVDVALLPTRDMLKKISKITEYMDWPRIEREAVALDVYDVIWPPIEPEELYRVA